MADSPESRSSSAKASLRSPTARRQSAATSGQKSPSSSSKGRRSTARSSQMASVMEGDEALIGVADNFYQLLRDDSRLERYTRYCDLKALAASLHRFLSGVFPGSWPRMQVSPELVTVHYEGLVELLLEAIKRPVALGELPMEIAIAGLSQELRDDERVVRFVEHLQNVAATWNQPLRDGRSEDVTEEEEEEQGEPFGTPSASMKSGKSPSQRSQMSHSQSNGHSRSRDEDDPEEASMDMSLAQGDAVMRVNIESLEELRLEDEYVEAVKDSWKSFLNNMETQEAAGEALYTVIFEALQGMQSSFKTPRAVQALRFIQSLHTLVTAVGDAPQLRMLVETVGFSHMQIEISVDNLVIFRDSILDLLSVELGGEFTEIAREGWSQLVSYAGGAILFVKHHYSERIRLLQESWAFANRRDFLDSSVVGGSAMGSAMGLGSTEGRGEKGRGPGLMEGSPQVKQRASHMEPEKQHSNSYGSAGEHRTQGQSIPKTFAEMFSFNAAVMGFGESAWHKEVLACFENIVLNISNSGRIHEECDVLSLRIATCTAGTVNFSEYKSCMLASMRSLLPKTWSTAHEVAWKWLWETVERLLQKNLGHPQRWHQALSKFMAKLDEDTLFKFRSDLYAHFFSTCATGQDFFKQSTTYLHVILGKVMKMITEFYADPVKQVDEISALGLRHVGYGITTDIVVPYVNSHLAVLNKYTQDPLVIEAYNWSLSLIAKILSRTLIEGSTIVMKAINQNSYKGVMKAASCAPRGERNRWMLVVQVGTQNISPLAWAIESGSLEAAKAMIQDLLTFRADRERYYFGADELFLRHPDIVKKLLDNASHLLPVLFDGLIWRSRLTESGMRRVNYYLKNLLCKQDSTPADNLMWVVQSKDPKIVCHPMMVAMSDNMWRVTQATFLLAKVLLIITLCLFMVSQSILPRLTTNAPGWFRRDVTFGCRIIVYCSLVYQMSQHIWKAYKAARNKDLATYGCLRVPRYIVEDWQEAVSCCLVVALTGMLVFEPIIWCWQDGIESEEIFTQECEVGQVQKFKYSVFGTVALMCYYLLLIDLTVFSNRISAYVLVAGRLSAELVLFLLALIALVVAFASILSVLDESDKDLEGIPEGSMTLAEMSTKIVDADRFKAFFHEPWVAVTLVVYLVLVVILLSNQLIAQLTCAYTSIFTDMVGLARLGRMKIIVETLPHVSKEKWSRFVASLKLDKRLEFNKGDVGIAGGVQLRELANEHPTNVDTILRFGGSTSPSMRWPESGSSAEEDQFDRLERLVRRTLGRHKGQISGSRSGSGSDSRHSSSKSGSHISSSSSVSTD